jgi:hypothetical protein
MVRPVASAFASVTTPLDTAQAHSHPLIQILVRHDGSALEVSPPAPQTPVERMDDFSHRATIVAPGLLAHRLTQCAFWKLTVTSRLGFTIPMLAGRRHWPYLEFICTSCFFGLGSSFPATPPLSDAVAFKYLAVPDLNQTGSFTR